jgi:hypothetical protein
MRKRKCPADAGPAEVVGFLLITLLGPMAIGLAYADVMGITASN